MLAIAGGIVLAVLVLGMLGAVSEQSGCASAIGLAVLLILLARCMG